MDDAPATKILAEIRDMLKRADDRAAEDRRLARAVAMHPSGLGRLCTLAAVLCVLLAIVSGYLSLAFAGGAALLLAAGVVSAWCGKHVERGAP